MWNIAVMLQPQPDHVGCGLFSSQFSAVPLLVPVRAGELWVYEAATAMHCSSCRFSSVWVIKRLFLPFSTLISITTQHILTPLVTQLQ